jgi:isopenicillin N synthase-like dioxygenase
MEEVRATLPVHPVDLEPFRLGGPVDRATVAAAIDAACRDSGFLLVSGHGVPTPLCDSVLDGFGAFFDRPLEEKRRVVVADESANRGYSELGKEGLAYSRGEETPPDLFEAFNIGREDAIGGEYDDYRDFYAPNVWPEQPAGLQATWLEYELALRGVADVLLEAMALALELPDAWFAERLERAVLTTRAINYERAPGAPDPADGQVRMGAHTDYGVLTILLADDVPGLQVFRDGQWNDVDVPHGSFVCNLGDMLERWTNNRWTSTLHRVVPPPREEAGPVRRRSVARFLDCPPDLVVECIPTCVDGDNPARYEPVVAGKWLQQKISRGRMRVLK